MATDYEGLLPKNVASEVIKAAREQSAVLSLARVRNLPAGTESIPVTSFLPTASFVNAHGGRKPITKMEWSAAVVRPEEIAVTIAIPDDFVADATFDVWGEVAPALSEAIAEAFDMAVLFGTGAPATYPSGGIINGLTPVTGNDLYDAFNEAMGAIEATGLAPNGILGDVGARKHVRGLRDADGRPLFYEDATGGAPARLLGLPYGYTAFWDSQAGGDFIVGDWSKLLVGIRQDIRVETSKDGVLFDEEGNVVVSAFQDDSTLMRAYVRIGVAVGKPVTRRSTDPAEPFALVAAGGVSE